MKPEHATINLLTVIFSVGLVLVSVSAVLANNVSGKTSAQSGDFMKAAQIQATTSPLEAPSIIQPGPAQGQAQGLVSFINPLPACLAEIAGATAVEDGTMRSAKSRESLLAAEKLGASAKESLLEMVDKATPAGRLLSLALLRRLNIEPGQYQKLASALNSSAGDQSVSYVSPTERCHYSVADILNDMASSRPLIKMLP